ncbi:MAG: MFS transporter [Armatimonadota bacterium]
MIAHEQEYSSASAGHCVCVLKDTGQPQTFLHSLPRQAEPAFKSFDRQITPIVPFITPGCVMITEMLKRQPYITNHKWIILGIVATGTLMSTLDASIVSVAMPTLTAVFHTNIGTSQWFVLAYTSTVTVLLLISGKLGDTLGRRLIYALGIAIFTLSSSACAASTSAGILIATRAIQAVGASMMMAVGPALVITAFPVDQRGESLGLIGSSVALGLLAGPLAGGLIIQHLSWRWMFLVNVPVGLALLIAMSRLHVEESTTRRGIDLAGGVLFALSISFLLAGLTHGQLKGWGSFTIFALFIAAVMCTAVFVLVEQSVTDPLLRLTLFRNRDFALGALTGWANYTATSPVPVFIPFYLQNVLGYDAQHVGLVIACSPLTVALVAPLAGTVSDRIGSRPLTVIGLGLTSIGLLSLRGLNATCSLADVVFRIVLTSLGSAIFVSPNSSAVMGSVPRDDLGTAAGIVALVRNLGMVSGVGAAGSVIETIQRHFSATGEIGHGAAFKELAFLSGLRSALAVCALTAALGALISTLRTTPLTTPHSRQT